MDPIDTEVETEFLEQLEAEALAYERTAERYMRSLRTLGGPGSGNFGHAGRPGEIGGSAPGNSGPFSEGIITSSKQFRTWFGDSKVVDSDGDPLVVYHGTTHDLKEFAEAGDAKLNPESDFGAGIYFTDSQIDMSENYAGVGPDLTSRIETRADAIDAEKNREWADHDKSVEEARLELVGENLGLAVPVYLSMKKPFVVGNPAYDDHPVRETWLTQEYEYSDPDDPDPDIVGTRGTLTDFLSALRSESSDFEELDGFDTFIDRVNEDGIDGMPASRLVKLFKETVPYVVDSEGRWAASELLRRALQRTGFDGIIDRTVFEKFGRMRGIGPDTTHYIIFKPTQAKSALGNRTFDPDNRLITMGESTMSLRDLVMRALGRGEMTASEARGALLLLAEMELKTAGGPGSGNFGHAGRPGAVGGSSAGDGTRVTVPKMTELMNSAKSAHTEFEKQTGKADEDWAGWYADYVSKQLGGAIATDRLKALITEASVKHTGSDWPERYAEHIVQHVSQQRALGGPGSGNFGHAGRPGEVGGSAPDGGWQSEGGFEHTGITWKQPTDASGRPVPIKVSSVEEAAALVLDGKVVELPDVKTAHTLLNKLATMANEAKAAGQEAKDYDLCSVSVAGTNLFCTESKGPVTVGDKHYPNGIPRVEMPQMGGKPVEGSEAAKLPLNKDGEVDGSEVFMNHLQSIGVKTTHETIPASELRASQRELVGKKVAGMMTAKTYDPAKKPIFISRDNYVVDGHHRWAAVVGRDAENGVLGDLKMNVVRVNAPISEVLHLANAWARKFGIAQKAATVKQSKSTGLQRG